MSDERKPDSPAQAASSISLSPNFRIIYANGFAYRASTSDFGLSFITSIMVPGQNPDGSSGNFAANVQEATVMLSLPSIRALSENLTRLMTVIEKEIGQIKVPKGSLITDGQLKSMADSLKMAPLEDPGRLMRAIIPNLGHLAPN
jgi:hypothetical protein